MQEFVFTKWQGRREHQADDFKGFSSTSKEDRLYISPVFKADTLGLRQWATIWVKGPSVRS